MSLLIDEDITERIRRLELPFNRHGVDPYGISQKDLAWVYTILAAFYRRYFRVRVYGVHNIPPRGRAMLVGNHSGGWALDGLMVMTACLLEMEPPRLAQGMAERFLSKLPLTAFLTNRLGHITGLPANAVHLLEDERLLLVFPEGARGTAKLYPERNHLVNFGTGFMRLALQTNTPIIPFAFVGGGDAIPTVTNLYRLGRLFGLPYLPVTPYGLPLPLPAPLEVYFSEPMRFSGTGNEDDAVVLQHVTAVKDRIAFLLEDGARRHTLVRRRP